jgi:phage shock protein PspC (stress-responsive transcriptional regulator)
MPRKPLHRSRRHRILAGVCGGIAESYGWQPTTVRILWILFGLLPVIPGTVLYLALWILVPLER